MKYIWLIPLLPGIGAAVNGLVGIRSFDRRTAGALATAMMVGALGIALLAFVQLLGLPHDAFVVVTHGRIDLHRKGLDVLVDAWRRVVEVLPAARLALIGSGRDDGAFAERASCSSAFFFSSACLLRSARVRKSRGSLMSRFVGDDSPVSTAASAIVSGEILSLSPLAA